MDTGTDGFQDMVVALMRSEGCNCAEAIIKTMAERFGFDQAWSRFGTVFGGGISRNADLCGFLTGGLVVISLRLGRADCSDNERKAEAYEAGNEYLRWFMDRFGRCCDIKGDPTQGPWDDCYPVGRQSVAKLIDILERY